MNFILKIKRRTQNEWVTISILFTSIFLIALIQFFKFPAAVKYLLDIAWLFLLVTLLVNKRMYVTKETVMLKKVVDLFFCITFVGSVIAFQSPLYYLWGIRNNFRFFVFFFSCIYFLDVKNIESYLNFLDTIYYLNFIITLFQYLVLNKSGDFLGGIFGVEKGCNGYTIIFVSIIITKSIVCYLNKKEKLYKTIIKSIIAIIIAALAELKVFYAIFPFILILANAFSSFSLRKIKVLFVGGAVILLGIIVLSVVFPSSVQSLTPNGMFSIAASNKGYTSTGDLNRLTAVPVILKDILRTPRQKLLGYGLGNCDTAGFSFLQTEFYRKYNYLNYTWFSSAFMLLETGVLGLLNYSLFYVMIFYCSHKRAKKKLSDNIYCQMVKILSLLSLVLIIYNSSLRTEAGYMMYFVLSVPFISDKSQNKQKIKE